MTRAQIFPLILILCDLGAALCALPDWRRCIYWIAAAVLTTTVTF